MSSTIGAWYDAAILQMASEAYLVGSNNADLIRSLLRGNNRPTFPSLGLTQFAGKQATDFASLYSVINQLSDDPTQPRTAPVYLPGTSVLANSGLSATLIKSNSSQEYTLAIRSTEFQLWRNGGDRERDGYGGVSEIFLKSGFPWAQLDALERYYDWLRHGDGAPLLPSDATLTVSGYSLGGALATAFTMLHPEVSKAYTFNGLGLGSWDQTKGTLSDMLRYYRAVLADPNAATLRPDETDPRSLALNNALHATGAFDFRSIYDDPRYQWAAAATQDRFATTYQSSSDPQRTNLGGVEGKITSLYGRATHNDAEWAANSGVHGIAVPVFIEGQPGVEWTTNSSLPSDFGNTHSIILLADSLALMKTFQEADANLSQAQLQSIFAAMSYQRNSRFIGDKVESDSLERALEALGEIAGVSSTTSIDVLRPVAETRGFGDNDARNRFYDGLASLSAALKEKSYRILPLIDMDYGLDSARRTVDTAAKNPVDMLEAAARPGEEGRAYRYALKELNPFVVLGADYAPLNEENHLELYDPENARGGMSERFIRDRADLMFRFMNAAVDNDLADGTFLPDAVVGPNNEPLRWKADEVYYEDRRRDFRLNQGGQFDTAPRNIFGSQTSEVISGGGKSDSLYGGDGSDVLNGNAGDDYLEGGLGTDVYDYSAKDGLFSRRNAGNDVILDGDGKGVLRYSYAGLLSVQTKVIGGVALQSPDGNWSSADGKFSYAFQGADMVVTINGDAGGSLKLKDFRNGDFGIRLQSERRAPEQSVREFIGDKEDWDSNPQQNGIQAQDDTFGNAIRADGEGGRPDITQANREDVFYGKTGGDAEHFMTGGGDDAVYADGAAGRTALVGGDDFIETGGGRDIVEAGAGNDWIEGGAGADILGGNAGNDTIYGDVSNGRTLTLQQAITAAETAQAVSGTGELLSGDNGADVIFGVATADFLLGGSDEDVIVGGAGDDTIYGDATLTSSPRDWTITRTSVKSGDAIIYQVLSPMVAWTSDVSAGASDVVYGGAGADWIFAGAGDDYAEGGAGDDVILGEAGNDIVLGGAGNDALDGDSSTAVAAGLAGDDFLDGGDGNDGLWGEAGNDILYGGAGDDTMLGGDGSDILYGGPGKDTLLGGAGKDTYVFNKGDGVETIQDIPDGTGNPDASVVVLSGYSRESVKFRQGSLLIDLGDGDAIHVNGFDSDDPWSAPVLDSIRFDDGSVMTYREVLDQGFDLDGTEGDDFIPGTAVTDRVDAKGGDDIVVGKAGDDDIFGGDGNDILQGGGGVDILFGGADDDQIEGGSEDDLLYGESGNDIVSGDFGVDELFGGEGDDQLDGGNGNDTLAGGAGDDRLAGDFGDDTLSGEAGDDHLSGKAGSDTYLFNFGDGHDVIDEGGTVAIGVADAASTDVLRFGAGISKADVTLLRRSNGDLLVRYGDDDQIIVAGQYVGLANSIERIEFDDGDFIDHAELLAQPVAPIEGTASDDVLFGTTGDDTLLGLDGDDVLDGGASPLDPVGGVSRTTGNDVLVGGPGADTYIVSVGMGKDTVVDSSRTPGQVSTLKLSAGLELENLRAQREQGDLLVTLRGRQDSIRIEDFYGSDGAMQSWQLSTSDGTTLPIDELINQAEPSGDVAAVAAMEDYQQSVLSAWKSQSRGRLLPTYAYMQSTWSQTVVTTRTEFNLPPQVEVLPAIQGTAVLGYGIKINNTIASIAPTGAYEVLPAVVDRFSDESIIEASATPNTVTANETHDLFVTSDVGGELQVTTFAVGPTTANTIYSMSGHGWGVLRLDASSANGQLTIQNVTSYPVLERIVGGDSFNLIYGALDAEDTHVALIDAGAGNDRIVAGARDFSYGNDGDDTIAGGAVAYGGNGADSISDAVNQYGGSGSDSLSGGEYMAGGAGDDTISGAEGATTFFIDPLETGHDYVEDTGGITSIDFENWYFQSIGIADPDESRDFGGMWGIIGPTGYSWFEKMGESDYSTVAVVDHYYRDDNGYGSDVVSVVFDSLGDLSAELSALGISYRAEDIRHIEPLSMAPEAHANDYAALEPLYEAGLLKPDILEFGPGLSFDAMSVRRNIDDSELTLTWGNGKSVAVRLAQADDPIGAGVELFEFADGTSYHISYLLDNALPFGGTPADDVLDYTDGDDVASGLEGNDQIHTYAGNDTLSGGPGSDVLEGGSGDDVYLFDRGDGTDFIWDEGGDDAVRFGVGIAPEDVTVTADPYGALYLVVADSEDRVGIGSWYEDDFRVETVEFSDGTFWDSAELESRVSQQAPSAASDVLVGTDGNDVIDSVEGNDLIFGLGGNDILVGGSGDDDIEQTGPGNSFIDAGTGDDYVYEDSPALVIAGKGDDSIDVYGDGGVIAFNPGDGNDTIYAGNALTLSLGGAIAAAQLSMRQEGDDLILTISAEDTIRLTRQYEDDPRAWPTITLQHVDDHGVTAYDFTAVIGDFYSHDVRDGVVFSLGDALQARTIDMSVDRALGGELAYQYARRGDVAALSTSAIQDVLADHDFGVAAQSVNPIQDTVLEGTPGDDVLRGTAQPDTLLGGAGNDVLDGGLGDDTYIFNIGDGVDHLVDSGGVDTLSFGPGITPSELKLGLGSLLIRVGDSDAIHIENFDPADALGSASIESFVFSDGTSITYENLLATGFDLVGTAGDDVITGTSVSDRIDGGAGNDTLDAGAGDDLYYFRYGDGADAISDPDGNDFIEFAGNITAEDVQVTGQDGSLTISLRNTGDELVIRWDPDHGYKVENVFFAGGDAWDEAMLVDHINDAPVLVNPVEDMASLEDEALTVEIPTTTFADVDTWDSLTYEATLADGSALPAWLNFDASTLTFSGLPANSEVGSHELRVTAIDQDGMSADATFTLTVVNVNDGPELALSLADQVATEDVSARFAIPANTFVDADAGDSITLSATSFDGTPLPAWLSFDPLSRNFWGTPGNGDVGEHALRVTATDRQGATASGEFSVRVSNVNDAPELTGPLANQLAYQGAPVMFSVPDSAFVDADAGDTMLFTATLGNGAPLPAWLSFDAGKRTFAGVPNETQVGSYAIQVRATDQAGATATGTFQLVVSDAGVYNTVNYGTKRSDVVRTGAANDLIDGAGGDDTVISGSGRDVVFGGTGNDTLTLGYGNDIGFGGDGKDKLDGGSGNDLLVGGDGADALDGGAGNDVLLGGAGKDELYGGDGNNLLIGSPGGDTLYGGSASDVFAFNRRDGKATIVAGDGGAPANRDTLSFGAGISAADIVLRRSGRDLIVKIDDAGEEREDGNVSVTLKDWYATANHRTINRLQLIGTRTELYDFTVLTGRFDAATRGKSNTWRAGSSMSAALLSVSDAEAIGGVLAHQYATTGTLSSVGMATLQATLSDTDFARAPQSISNAQGETLAAYFAQSGRETDDRDYTYPGLPDRHGDSAVIPGPHDREDGNDRDDNAKHAGSGASGERGRPLDLQAILDATETFVGYERRESSSAPGSDSARSSSTPVADGGVSSWALTNALLQFHLSGADSATLGSGGVGQYAGNVGLAGVSLPAAQALVGAPGFGLDAHSLRQFNGLQEGLVKIG